MDFTFGKKMKSLLSAVFLLCFAGCTTTETETWKKPSPFLIVPTTSALEIESGRAFEITFTIYNTTNEDVIVPDPKKLRVTFVNVDAEDPLIDLYPFYLHGGPIPPPKPEIRLKKGDKISSTIEHSFTGSGTFLVSAYGYDEVMIPLKIIEDENRPNKSVDTTAVSAPR